MTAVGGRTGAAGDKSQKAKAGLVRDLGPEEGLAERYGLVWPGKSACLQEALQPPRAMLVPVPAESVNFSVASHLFIEGDNLEAMKLLLPEYGGGIKIIYIDPPYNGGRDLIYPDNYGAGKAAGRAAGRQCRGRAAGGEPDFSAAGGGRSQAGSSHTGWLNMIYPRLLVARRLLRDDGVMFVSIDDHEVHNLRAIMDEIFGEENFVAAFPWKGRGGRQDSAHVAAVHEYVLAYAKERRRFVAGGLPAAAGRYPRFDPERDRRYRLRLARKWGAACRREDRPNLWYPVTAPDGSEVYPWLPGGQAGRWRWGREKMAREIAAGNVEFVREGAGWTVYEKVYEPAAGEQRQQKYTTWLDDAGSAASGTADLKKLFGGAAPFDFPKPVALIDRLLHIAAAGGDDIVLDFFAGSSTTAQAVLEYNCRKGCACRCICIEQPQPVAAASAARRLGLLTTAAVGKERIRRCLARLHGKETPQMDLFAAQAAQSLGFRVYRLA